MNTRMQTDAWIYYFGIVLDWILVAILVGIRILTIIKQSFPELLYGLGSVAASDLARLLIPSS